MKKCIKCKVNDRKKNQRWCSLCHAEYMRKWRKTHPRTEEQRMKDICRSYAGVYKKRGLLIPEPCRVCGSNEVQMHHEDYSKPLEVDWLCEKHHRQLDND